MTGRFAIELVDADDPEAVHRAVLAVNRDGRTRLLRQHDIVIGVLTAPIPAFGRGSDVDIPLARPFTTDDPLLKAAGIFEGDGPGDVSENVDRYLAEAYEERHR